MAGSRVSRPPVQPHRLPLVLPWSVAAPGAALPFQRDSEPLRSGSLPRLPGAGGLALAGLVPLTVLRRLALAGARLQSPAPHRKWQAGKKRILASRTYQVCEAIRFYLAQAPPLEKAYDPCDREIGQAAPLSTM